MSKSHAILGEVHALLDRADAEGRELTASEMQQYETLMSRVKHAGEIEQKMRELNGGPVTSAGPAFGASRGGDPGTRFIESEGYKQHQERRQPRPDVDVRPRRGRRPASRAKGTLLESPGGGGGAFVPVPSLAGHRRHAVPAAGARGPAHRGQATGNTVRYITKGTATSGAAGVAEGGLKPESTLGFSTIDESVKKVATCRSATRRSRMRRPSSSFINGQLSCSFAWRSERQFLRGTSGGAEVQGLLTSRTVPVYTAGTAQGNMAEQLFKAANSMRGSAFIEPDWFVVHPADYQKLRLLKDTAGQLIGGGPWLGQYGNGGQVNAGWMNGGAIDTLWDKPCYVVR